MAKSKGQQRRERQRREALQAQKVQQQLLAQQKREVERQEREAKRAEEVADRERRAQYVAERVAEAEELTAAGERRSNELSTVLLTGLKRRTPLDFGSMRLAFAAADFVPGDLGKAEPAPRWQDFARPNLACCHVCSAETVGGIRPNSKLGCGSSRRKQFTSSERSIAKPSWTEYVSSISGGRPSANSTLISTMRKSMHCNERSALISKMRSSAACGWPWKRPFFPEVSPLKPRLATGRTVDRC